MGEVALFLRIRTKPGRRADMQALWEAHLKPRVAQNPAQPVYCYCLSREHPDDILLFEHYADETVLEDNAQSQFFADFMAEAAPLMAGEPEAALGDPVWIKR